MIRENISLKTTCIIKASYTVFHIVLTSIGISTLHCKINLQNSWKVFCLFVFPYAACYGDCVGLQGRSVLPIVFQELRQTEVPSPMAAFLTLCILFSCHKGGKENGELWMGLYCFSLEMICIILQFHWSAQACGSARRDGKYRER